ncbi:hypothetical protein QUF80_14530 [Desulfococcaceae bacterium HSG8]|nr:hypothetical protein [Desulfococcaceae bacterium HSG8]
MQAIRLERTVEKSGELHLTNLSLEEGQQVELLLLVVPKAKAKCKKRLTARQLLNSGLIGIWEDRTDISNSAEYARQLRKQAQRPQP